MKLAVLDRYGTLCAEPPPHTPRLGEWNALPGALEAVARLNQAGWHVVLMTTQPGLGRGLYDCAALNEYHRQMYKRLAAAGAKLDAVFFCPHAPEDQCDCLAPQAQLLRQVLERFGVEASKVAVIGSRGALLQAGAVVGARLYRVGTAALPGVELPELPMPCITAYDTLQDCVAALVEREHECAAAAPG